MSEFMSRGSESAHDYAPARASYHAPVHVASPSEVAASTVVELERDSHDIDRRIAALRAAHDANDVDGWHEERNRLDVALGEAHRARDRAHERASDMDTQSHRRLASAEQGLEHREATAATLTEPPKGFVHVHGESELDAALSAPITGGAAAGYKRKEAELRALFEGLSAVDSRNLAERLRRPRQGDPLAKAFGRMTSDRRQRLLRILDEAPRRAALQHETEMRGGAASSESEHHVEISVSAHPHFEPTELGSISKPIEVTFVNFGDEPVTIDSLVVDTQDPARAREIDVITRAAGLVLKPTGSITIEVAFRPVKPLALHSTLSFHGHSASSRVTKGTLLVAPAPLKAVEKHADDREYALAARASRDLENESTTPATATYGDMLAAVLAAEKLTHLDQRERAGRLLEGVDRRLAQLDEVAFEKLSDYGFANGTGHAIFDHSKSAVALWSRKLHLGASIATAPLVDEFRVGAEAIRLCTGERKDAPNLRAFDRASKWTALGALALAASPAVMAMAVEEAGLLTFAGGNGARTLAIWALHNPAAALAVSEALIGFGIQVGEDGWDAFASQLDDPRGRVFIFMQVAMDAMHVHAAAGEPRLPARGARAPESDPLPQPSARSPVPGGEVSADGLDPARENVTKVRKIISGAYEQATKGEPSVQPKADAAKPANHIAQEPAHDADQVRARDSGAREAQRDDIKRVPQKGDDGHEYQYDQMHPGPLSDREVYDPHNTGAQLPAQGFYGAKYDVMKLEQDTVLYRVGNAEREWGEWFTDHRIDSEAQYRIDLAVKREWSDPRTGEMPPSSARSQKQLELWSYAILIPKGTTVYPGQVASQGGVFMGGLGPGSKQYFIPKAWTLQSNGAKVISKAPFRQPKEQHK
jgi:hypothetical protein